MKNFNEFIDKKQREAKKQLGIVKKVLEQNGLNVQDNLDDSEPYIYVKTVSNGTMFEGIRIYKIGDTLAFRVQNESKTHPYGRAYMLDVEAMYADLLSDHKKEEDAGKEVIKSIASEIKNFFVKSSEAEKELRAGEFENDPMNNVMTGIGGSGYSSKLYSNNSFNVF